MLYKDIIKKICKQRGLTMTQLAGKLGRTQQAFSSLLSASHNPTIGKTNEILDQLGYEVVFAPKGMIEQSPALSESCYVVELPEKK